MSAIIEELKAFNVQDISQYNNSDNEGVVICTAKSQLHMKAVSGKIEKYLKDTNIRIYSKEIGDKWILLYTGMLVLHVFLEDKRREVDLDSCLEAA